MKESMAAPWTCSKYLPWKKKYVFLRQNPSRVMIWGIDIEVLLGSKGVIKYCNSPQKDIIQCKTQALYNITLGTTAAQGHHPLDVEEMRRLQQQCAQELRAFANSTFTNRLEQQLNQMQ